MKAARETAHSGLAESPDFCRGGTEMLTQYGTGSLGFRPHSDACDRLTAAIEARDAEHARERDALVDVAVTAGENILIRERDTALQALKVARKELEAVRSFIARYDDGGLYFEGWEHSDSEHIVGHVTDALATIDALAPHE